MIPSQTSARHYTRIRPIACGKIWAQDHASTTCQLSLRRRRSHVKESTLETHHYTLDDMARIPGHHPAGRVVRGHTCLLERPGHYKSHRSGTVGFVDHD